MPTFEEACVVKKSNKAKKAKGFRPYNSLTAALAKKAAIDDMKKQKK
jgi:hypothetical protein